MNNLNYYMQLFIIHYWPNYKEVYNYCFYFFVYKLHEGFFSEECLLLQYTQEIILNYVRYVVSVHMEK